MSLACVGLWVAGNQTGPQNEAKQVFDQWMARGMSHLEREAYAEAKAAFSKAAALRPGAAGVIEGLAQASQGLLLQTIAQQQVRAAAHEAGEAWGAAEKIYLTVLQLDPSLVFAQEGLRQAQKLARLHRELDYHLSHPQRLGTEAVLDEASALAGQVAEVTNPGALLLEKLARLQQLTQSYAKPQNVILHSDGQTAVRVNHLGSMGSFTEKVVQWRPGTYTLVGSRAGYRDIRLKFTLKPGQPPAAPVVIRCEEKI